MLHDFHIPRHGDGVGWLACPGAVWRNKAVFDCPRPVVGNGNCVVGKVFYVFGQREIKIHNPYAKGDKYIRGIFFHWQVVKGIDIEGTVSSAGFGCEGLYMRAVSAQLAIGGLVFG